MKKVASSSEGQADDNASCSLSRSRADSVNDFDDIEPVDASQAKIAPRSKPDAATNSIRAIDELIHDVDKNAEIQLDHFESKEQMQKYENEDYRVKAFLMLITAGKRKKMWMPGKTVFDKRGGKYSDKVAGLGQVPGLQWSYKENKTLYNFTYSILTSKS